MKNYCILLLLLAFSACADKYRSISDAAPAPFLSFSKDTVSIREKDYTNINSTNNGKLTLRFANPAHQLNVQFSDTSGKVHFFYRGTEIKSGQPLVVIDDFLDVFCNCDTAGLYAIDFYLTDLLGKIANKTLFVRSNPNQAAKANFFYFLLDSSQWQNWAYRFNGSNTIDPDGVITAYHYTVNGQPITTTVPEMDFTFHAVGMHVIGLYVTDDLGLNSDTVYHQIMIP